MMVAQDNPGKGDAQAFSPLSQEKFSVVLQRRVIQYLNYRLNVMSAG
jgi:hypothetical protein